MIIIHPMCMYSGWTAISYHHAAIYSMNEILYRMHVEYTACQISLLLYFSTVQDAIITLSIGKGLGRARQGQAGSGMRLK